MSKTPDATSSRYSERNQWPSIGIAMPTVDNAEQACQAMQAFLKSYPGRLQFAVVANGTSGLHLEALRTFAKAHAANIHVVTLKENVGYGAGCNAGLAALSEMGGFDLIGVTNDDVYPTLECLSEMVAALCELEKLGHNPGLIGPVSNNINGPQQKAIGEYADPSQLEARAREWLERHHESVTETVQLRGLFFLMTQTCFQTVGGFDTCFGIGNFEDDDLNLRARLAGFTIWIADGAFLHHYGSTTFRSLGIDYTANMQRNAETFLRKWKLQRLEDWPTLAACPEGTSLHCPVGHPQTDPRFRVRLNGEVVDLVEQASDVEFAAWIVSRLSSRPRTDRLRVLETVEALSQAA